MAGHIELTPEIKKQLVAEGVVFASNWDELPSAGDQLFNQRGILTAGQRLDAVVAKWKGLPQYSPTDWSLLHGARVLDIASGSYLSDLVGMTYYPHFARLCAVNGAQVTALDIEAQSITDLMLFQGVKVDLIPLIIEERLSSLPQLQDRKFDIINCSNFVGRTPLRNLVYELRRRRVNLLSFEWSLLSQCFELIAEGGLISLQLEDSNMREVYHQKVDGTMMLI